MVLSLDWGWLFKSKHVALALTHAFIIYLCWRKYILIRWIYSIKLRFPFCLIKHFAINVYGWEEIQNHALLSLATDGNDWSASVNGHYMAGEKPHVPSAQGVVWRKGQVSKIWRKEIKNACWPSSGVQLIVLPQPGKEGKKLYLTWILLSG